MILVEISEWPNSYQGHVSHVDLEFRLGEGGFYGLVWAALEPNYCPAGEKGEKVLVINKGRPE